MGAITVERQLVRPGEDGVGVHWLLCGLPWSLLLFGLLLADLLPENAYVSLAMLVLCALANVAVVHFFERRQRAGSQRVEP